MWTVTMDDGDEYAIPRESACDAREAMRLADNVARYWARTHRAASAV
jgi:hypothetical protein